MLKIVVITGIGCDYTNTALVDVTESNAYNTMTALPVCCEEYNFTVSGVDRSNRESEPATEGRGVNFSGRYVCVYEYLYLFMCVCLYVCMYVCVYACMNVGI